LKKKSDEASGENATKENENKESVESDETKKSM
jgi:hypothetical protein